MFGLPEIVDQNSIKALFTCVLTFTKSKFSSWSVIGRLRSPDLNSNCFCVSMPMLRSVITSLFHITTIKFMRSTLRRWFCVKYPEQKCAFVTKDIACVNFRIPRRSFGRLLSFDIVLHEGLQISYGILKLWNSAKHFVGNYCLQWSRKVYDLRYFKGEAFIHMIYMYQ